MAKARQRKARDNERVFDDFKAVFANVLNSTAFRCKITAEMGKPKYTAMQEILSCFAL